MLICPDCRETLDDFTCTKCDWSSKKHTNNKVIDYLGENDLKDPVFKTYLQNYEHICSDDLKKTILPEDYLNHHAMSIVNYIGSNLENKRICDIGSGQGFLIKYLLSKGAKNVTAVDICDQYLNNLPNTVRCIKANAENLPFKEEFDIVIATDILEHVFNPGSFLYCIHNSLKNNGEAYIRVPYKENLMSYSPHLGCPYRFVHLRSFNELLLKQSVTDAGLTPISLYYDGFWLQSPNKFWQFNNFNKAIYNKILSIIYPKSYKYVTSSHNWFCRLFMRPYELTIKTIKYST